MKKVFITIVCFLLCVPGMAAELNLILSGSQYYLVGKDTAGNIVTRKITVQIMNLDGTNVPPVDPPTVDPLVNLKNKVKVSTDKVVQAEPTKTNTRTALAKLYRTVSGLPVTDRSQLVQATDAIFVNLSLPPEWITWKKEIDQFLLSFVGLDDAKKAWQIIAESLEGK